MVIIVSNQFLNLLFMYNFNSVFFSLTEQTDGRYAITSLCTSVKLNEFCLQRSANIDDVTAD